MTFVTAGLAIAGLAAMTIPIIIHLLFRQRRKPIEWAAMRFLLEAYRRQRRRLQLEQLLLLALRCLVIGLLGFALARPMLQDAGLLDTGASRVVYLVIDNSMTASATDDENISSLQRHIDAAVATVESLGASDTVAVITAARPVRAMLNPPTTDHSAVIRLLRSLEPAASPADLPGAMRALAGAVEAAERPDDQVLAYLLSDFRAGSADLDAPPDATLTTLADNVQLFASPPAQQALANVQIASIDPVRSVVLPGTADGSGQITVRLARHGGALDADVSRVRLELGDSGISRTDVVNWQPGQSEATANFLMNIPVTEDRELNLTASIDHDRLETDDQRFAVLTLRDRVGVLLIDRRRFTSDQSIEQLSAGQWVRRALEPAPDSPMEFIEVEPAALSQPDLRGADVMILARPDLLEQRGWQLVQQFVREGGLLLLMPPAERRVHQWTDALSEYLALPWQLQMEIVEHQPPLFFADQQPRDPLLRMLSSEMSDLLLPASIYRTLPVLDTTGAGRSLLELSDGTPGVLAVSPSFTYEADDGTAPVDGSGLVVFLTFAPELSWTNIPTKPLMVPLLQELIRQGLSQIRASRQAIVGLPHQASHAPASDGSGPGDQKIATVTSAEHAQPFEQPGLYTIVDRGQQPVGTLAVNVDPAAGRTQTQSEAAVQAWLRTAGPWEFFETDNITAALRRENVGSPISRFILVIVLALVVLEAILARWFSHSYRSGAGSADDSIAASTNNSRRPFAGVAPAIASRGSS